MIDFVWREVDANKSGDLDCNELKKYVLTHNQIFGIQKSSE